MAQIKTINVYPPAKDIDISKEIGNIKDNDLPIFEPVDIVLVKNAYIGYYGYITKSFKNIEQIVSPRHRYSVSFFSILSNYFIKKKKRVNQPALSITNGWYDSFYHFTLECLLKLFVLREYLNEATLVFPSKQNDFHKQWIEILEIKNIIYINENEVVDTSEAISCNFPNRDLNHHNIILPEFRNWILNKIVNNNVLNTSKIFVGRPIGSKRNLKNQKELSVELMKFGFLYIEMENYKLVDQINIFRNANQIIAVHGAALTHLAFCSANSKVIDLIHEDFQHQFCFLKLSKILNLNYILFPCKGDQSIKGQSGYKDINANIDAVLNIIKTW